jgi:hypothetical protein
MLPSKNAFRSKVTVTQRPGSVFNYAFLNGPMTSPRKLDIVQVSSGLIPEKSFHDVEGMRMPWKNMIPLAASS